MMALYQNKMSQGVLQFVQKFHNIIVSQSAMNAHFLVLCALLNLMVQS